MLAGERLDAALRPVRRIVEHGPWWRCVAFRHLFGPSLRTPGPPRPLWGGAAALAGARFTPKAGFESLYWAGDPVTALAEVRALVMIQGGPLPLITASWTWIAVDGAVGRVLDLTDAATLAALETQLQEMTGVWAALPDPPTQSLARARLLRAPSGAFAILPPRMSAA